jgi:5'(3')-deoxyribonucleotidase
MTKYAKIILLILLSAFLYLPDHLRASEAPKDTNLEDAAFLFYKMVDQEPDYDFWTKHIISRSQERFGQMGKRDHAQEVRKNLIQKYETLDPAEKSIVISYPAYLEAIKLDKESDNSDYFINIYFKEDFFLERDIPGYRVNYVIPNFDEKIRLTLSSEDYNKLKSRFYAERVFKENAVHLKFYMKPVRVDPEKTTEHKGKTYQMMLMDLEKFEIYDDTAKKIYWPFPLTEEEIKAQEDEKAKIDFFDKYK